MNHSSRRNYNIITIIQRRNFKFSAPFGGVIAMDRATLLERLSVSDSVTVYWLNTVVAILSSQYSRLNTVIAILLTRQYQVNNISPNDNSPVRKSAHSHPLLASSWRSKRLQMRCGRTLIEIHQSDRMRSIAGRLASSALLVTWCRSANCIFLALLRSKFELYVFEVRTVGPVYTRSVGNTH